MPKIVDHDQRREELIGAAIRVIKRVGLDNATTRLIAQESGFSNGVLAHYFEDKDGILESIIRFTHARIAARQARDLEGLTGAAALRALLADNLPLDDERRDETLLEMSFWTRAVHSEALLAFQEEQAGKLLDRIVARIDECRESGCLTSDVDSADLAELLAAHIDGISVHAMMFPTRLDAGRQELLLDTFLRGEGFDLG